MWDGSGSVERRSKLLFGNQQRVRIAAAVARAEGDLVHALEISQNAGVAHNVASSQLKEFVLAGVMEDGPSVAGQRFRYFRRLPSCYWRLSAELLGEFEVACANRQGTQTMDPGSER